MRTMLVLVAVAGSLVPAHRVIAETSPPAPLAHRSEAEVSALIQPIVLASTSDFGGKGNGTSSHSELSASADRVAFQSVATNLDPADTDVVPDVYLKDLTTGQTTLASTSDAGVKGNDGGHSPAISADGTRVVFRSASTNLDPGDTDVVPDIFVKVIDTGNVILASTSDVGVKGDFASQDPAPARAGRKVAFASFSNNLDPGDTDTTSDVYLKNLRTGDIVLTSTSTGGVKGNGSSTSPGVSDSGDRVAFTSASTNLDPSDLDTLDDVYVKELSTGTLFLVSTSDAGVKGNAKSYSGSISGGGRKVAFASFSTNLDSADTDSLSDIYVKNLSTGDLVLASTTDTGIKANAASASPEISGDGKRVAFQSSATNLDPADTSPDLDIYVKDLVTGDVALASSSDMGEKGDDNSRTPAISGKGRSVAFESDATNLDPVDADSVTDVYVKEPIVCSASGTEGDDNLVGGAGKDVLCGRGGHDSLDGQGGGDILLGDEGDDTLVGGAGADQLDGGSETDTVSYETSPGGVFVELIIGEGFQSDAEGDTYFGIENAVGSAFFDELDGDDGPNVLYGGADIDILAGVGGDDQLFGNDGGDYLVGGPGGDYMIGGTEFDLITYSESPAAVAVDLAAGTATGGNAEGDTFLDVEGVVGSAFADTLSGDAGDNTVSGNSGDDVLTGGGGADTIEGLGGMDVAAYGASPAPLTADLAAQTVSGGDAGGDVITGIEGILGSAFADILTGGGGDDIFMGMAGGDDIDGAGGTDAIYYMYSPAAVTVDLTAQTVTGGHATGDLIAGIESAGGSTFADVLAGDAGPNTFEGLAGDDTLYGLDGDDTLGGGNGTDSFFGGTGTDACDDVVGETATSCEI